MSMLSAVQRVLSRAVIPHSRSPSKSLSSLFHGLHISTQPTLTYRLPQDLFCPSLRGSPSERPLGCRPWKLTKPLNNKIALVSEAALVPYRAPTTSHYAVLAETARRALIFRDIGNGLARTSTLDLSILQRHLSVKLPSEEALLRAKNTCVYNLANCLKNHLDLSKVTYLPASFTVILVLTPTDPAKNTSSIVFTEVTGIISKAYQAFFHLDPLYRVAKKIIDKLPLMEDSYRLTLIPHENADDYF